MWMSNTWKWDQHQIYRVRRILIRRYRQQVPITDMTLFSQRRMCLHQRTLSIHIIRCKILQVQPLMRIILPSPGQVSLELLIQIVLQIRLLIMIIVFVKNTWVSNVWEVTRNLWFMLAACYSTARYPLNRLSLGHDQFYFLHRWKLESKMLASR